MAGKFYAIFIGINSYEEESLATLRYAEKDCADLKGVLTDPTIGSFSPENVVSLVGKDATTRRVEETLYTQAVKNRTADDVVLVYYSGHGFIIGDRRRAYLATHDVKLDTLLSNPNDGIRMDYLHDQVFLESASRHILLVLDCCHSGAFVPPSLRDAAEPRLRDLLHPQFFSGGTGRIAFVACPPDATSRENPYLQNGVFTHYLVKGLRGEAGEADSGEVTIDSLITYVRSHLSSEQLPGRYGQDYGRIVLTKPGWRVIEGSSSPLPESRIELGDAANVSSRLMPLQNPLEAYVPFPRSLSAFLSEHSVVGEADSVDHVLEGIRVASDAEFVFLLQTNKEGWTVKARSSLGIEGQTLSSYLSSAAARIAPGVVSVPSSGAAPAGVYVFDPAGGLRGISVAVTVRYGFESDTIVVCGLPVGSHCQSEPYGKMLGSVYRATQHLTSVRPRVLEAAIYDDLKETYGFVPLEMYQRRLELFREQLSSAVVYFEPILCLDLSNLHISSWEALARDPESMVAPASLFKAAELWGARFQTELDINFARLATKSYMDAWSKVPGRRQLHDIRPLSVNVYPRSLMSSAYFDSLAQSIRDAKIGPRKLVLEISEKQELPEVDGATSPENRFVAFRDRLKEYVQRMQISFALDDFGSGHSSPSRLMKLNPAHVKIDREVLQHPSGDLLIQFVLAAVEQHRLEPPTVIQEGLDGSSLFTLDSLYKLGIRHVQGYVVGRAGPKVGELKPSLRNFLSSLLISVNDNI